MHLELVSLADVRDGVLIAAMIALGVITFVALLILLVAGHLSWRLVRKAKRGHDRLALALERVRLKQEQLQAEGAFGPQGIPALVRAVLNRRRRKKRRRFQALRQLAALRR